MENLVNEKLNDKKQAENAKKQNKLNILKKRLVALLCSASLLASAGGYTAYKLNKVDELLSLTGIEADEEAIKILEEKYGEISGSWVDLYLSLFSRGDIHCVAENYISKDGNPINNTLNGTDIEITNSDGQTIVIKNYSGNGLIYSDEQETNIPTISRKDLRENYELGFGVVDSKLVGGTEDGTIYKSVYGPKLYKK